MKHESKMKGKLCCGEKGVRETGGGGERERGELWCGWLGEVV